MALSIAGFDRLSEYLRLQKFDLERFVLVFIGAVVLNYIILLSIKIKKNNEQ